MKGDGVWEMMCARVIVDRGVRRCAFWHFYYYYYLS